MPGSVETVANDLTAGFLRLHTEEAAAILETSPVDEVSDIVAGMEPRIAAEAMAALTPETGAEVLRKLPPEFATKVIAELPVEQAAVLLSRFDGGFRDRITAGLDPGIVREIQVIMSYPPDTAGSLMDPRVYTFRLDARVGDAVSRLRAGRRRNVHAVYLLDENGRLAGSIPLDRLVVSEDDASLGSLSRGVPISVPAIADREEVAEVIADKDLTALPVVDAEGRLIGVVRHEALYDVVEEEATADMQSMVGASRRERALSPVPLAVRARLPWLQVNLATAFLAASVVGLFEETIARFTALAVLLPVVAGQSGNTGSQALAVTLRGLALREVRGGHWPRVVVKEFAVGVINGLAVAVVTATGVYVWSRSLGLSAVIAVAMVSSMAIAGVTGALIPIILSAIGQDPAQSSSIVLTTITDIAGFFSFLGLATLFSGIL